ncbi:MAG: RHS repeat-associated core domain-containing protein [Limisphaerales bacterium]
MGLTGKSYDIKASLMDYSARWYSPVNGRFTTQDTWLGVPFTPQTLNRYAYALNNPLTITDPTGHIPCEMTDTGEPLCSMNPPEDWGTPHGPGGGGGTGGGTGGGGSTPDPDPLPGEGGGIDPNQLRLQRLMQKQEDMLRASGIYPQERSSYTYYDLTIIWMFQSDNYHPRVSFQDNVQDAQRTLRIKGATTRDGLLSDIQRIEENHSREGYCQSGADNGRDPECNLWRLMQAMGPPDDQKSGETSTSSATLAMGLIGMGKKGKSFSQHTTFPEQNSVSANLAKGPGNSLTKIDNYVDLTGHRKDHILNRHRAGTGKPGKTEFPAGWSDDRILHQVSDVASDPNAIRGVGKYDSPYAIGVRDGIEIRVDFYPNNHKYAGQISTAYPTNVPAKPSN